MTESDIQIKEINTEGMEIVGRGVSCEVYRVDEKKVLKLYFTNTPLSVIKEQYRIAKNAFAAGVPTAEVFDLVQCGKRYGVIFEYLTGKALAQEIGIDADKRLSYGTRLGVLLKQVHTADVEKGAFPTAEAIMEKLITMCGDFLTDKQADAIRAYWASFPGGGVLLHGDFHENNIMLQDGTLRLIDLDNMHIGSPFFDFAQMYGTYKAELPPELAKKMNLTEEVRREFLDNFLRAYFGEDVPMETLRQYDDIFTEGANFNRFFTPIIRVTPETESKVRSYVAHEFVKIEEMMQRLPKRFSELPW